jgi:hypothetical protein
MKRSRILLLVLGILIAIVVIALVSLPTYLESYIEDNDRELLGREISIENIDINYFTGELLIEGFSIREIDHSTIFTSFDRLTLDLEITDLIAGDAYITSFYIDGLFARVTQDGTSFNFDDLLELGSTTDSTSVEEESETMHFTLENFQINGASIEYSSDIHPKAQFDSIHIQLPLFSDTVPVFDVISALHVGTGGYLSTTTQLDLDKSEYDLLLEMEDLDISLIQPYFEPYIELNRLEGLFNSDFRIHGSWADTDVLDLGGTMRVRDFLLTDKRDDTALQLGAMEIEIDTVKMKEAVYNIDHFFVNEFYALYEMYDDGDNWTNMLILSEDSTQADTVALVSDSEEEIDYSNPFSVLGYYLKDIAKSYSESTYRIEEIVVSNSAVDFNDYIPSQPFRYELREMELHADSLNSSEDWLTFTAKSKLNNTGVFDGYLKVSTANIEDIDLHYDIKGTELSFFSPYTNDYIDYPVSEGELLYTCDTKIRDGIIKSQNVIKVNQFNFGSSYDGDPFYNLPVKLAVSLLKDLDGNIELDVPVEGDLNDPNYKLGKVIWSTVKNILLKAVTAPFRLLARTFGMKEKDLEKIRFGHLQMNLDKANQKHLDDLSKILKNKEDLNIEFKRITKKYEAIENYAIVEAKYRYLYKEPIPEVNEIPEEMLDELMNFDVKDSLFGLFVNEHILEQDYQLPIQRKCMLMVGEKNAESKVDKVGYQRSTAISDYLIEQKGLAKERIRFTALPEDSLITNRSNSVYNVGFWVEE